MKELSPMFDQSPHSIDSSKLLKQTVDYSAIRNSNDVSLRNIILDMDPSPAQANNKITHNSNIRIKPQ